ncbi:siderophore-iron reductase FhuF [Roseibium limicola]|uniref:Siderophore-iron reductase FhuF n=1 Tax=Roseibium limicola TaxID=2816037 RepID=A0A939EUJ1_9HYPH|nr:siderophore-iron reductase FhuF [Roseibium limicola]MBO0347374.1 siderophore-iron reductase FhuF [Roseibium limicola]
MPAAAPGSDETIDLTDYTDGLFHGAAAHLVDRFVIEPGSADGRLCSDLLDPASLFHILEDYSVARYPNSDRRSAASMWAQYYFGFLIPPLILLGSDADCELPDNPDNLRLVLDKDHQPRRFILTDHLGRPLSGTASPFERMETFIERHLAPLVFSLSARSGVSAKVFWMSAAVILDYTCDVFLKPGQMSFKPLTQERLLPNGERNPLFGPYRPSGSEATRTRRICCMRYNLEDVDRCPDCPLKPKPPRERTERPALVTQTDETP